MSNTPPNVSPISQSAQPVRTEKQPQQATPPHTTPTTQRATPARPPQPTQPLPSATTTQTTQATQATRAEAQAPPQQQAFPAFIPIPGAPAPVSEPKSRREKLNAGDALWKWKLGLRGVLIVIGLIGLGCAAWAVSRYGPGKMPLSYELDDAWTMPWTLITFSISILWSFLCIAVFLTRRPHAPVHPGCQVGVDLILWLAYIFTVICGVIAVRSVMDLGSDGTIGSWYRSSDAGYYTYAAGNNTWVWHQADHSSYYYGDQRSCNRNSTSASYYYSDYRFATCDQEDLFVNALWRDKNHRFNVELTAAVCQCLALTLHLVLFIWACVDTHYKNKKGVSKEAEQLAADIVMNMVRSGAIIPPPGAHMRPMAPQMIPPHLAGQYAQQYPQQYPQQYLQQYPQQQFQERPPVLPPRPAVASSSNEKSAGPRYA